VHAHLLAAERLLQGSPGGVYFVSDGEPVPLWWMIGELLAAAGAPPPRGSVPAWAASAAGAVLEAVHGMLGREGEPTITRFAAQQLSHHEWFDISAARRDLGYAPRVTVAEGLARLRESLARVA
jgi:nucleoside-diphosphate-sugar epimerase